MAAEASGYCSIQRYSICPVKSTHILLLFHYFIVQMNANCFFSKYRTCDVSSGSLPVSAVDVDYMISDTHLNTVQFIVQKPFKCYTLKAMFAFVGSCVHLLQEL